MKIYWPQYNLKKATAHSNQPGRRKILPAVSNMLIDKTWQRWEIMSITPLTAPDWCHWWQIKAVSLSRSQSEIHCRLSQKSTAGRCKLCRKTISDTFRQGRGVWGLFQKILWNYIFPLHFVINGEIHCPFLCKSFCWRHATTGSVFIYCSVLNRVYICLLIWNISFVCHLWAVIIHILLYIVS